ncbi:uncharacterized protein LOC144911195 isoform X1 [Branchiostoma floridae x Branchiostoma belcheri]
MAGCSNARCSSERRSLRRELDHWRKDLITCVGLESFAEFLMGPERFKEVMPFNGFEPVDCPDWEPSSECRLCHARREVVTESLEHHKELIERQRTLEEAHTQDFPGSYVPFKFSSAQEAIRHLASHHASKQQQSSQSALQEDSDNLDSEEDDLPPSPQNNSCNGSGARKLRNSPYFLKIPRVPFGHDAQEKVSHRHVNEVMHPTAEHLSIPATTMKTSSTASAQHCNGTGPQLKPEKSHSVCDSSPHQALGNCPSSNRNVSPNVLHQSLTRPNNSSPVPTEVHNLNSNTYNDTRCLDEDFLWWVIYLKGRKGRHLFSLEDLEMNCSDTEIVSSVTVTDDVSQAKAAVSPASAARDTTVHKPPTSADDKVQETHTSTTCQLTSNLKTCQNNSSLQDMISGEPGSDKLRKECKVEAGQVGAKNDPIGNIHDGKSIYDSDMDFDGDKGCVDLHASYLFKPVSLSSGLLPSDKSGNDSDSDASSFCSISPPSLSPVTGYDTCSDRDLSQSSVYSLEENEDESEDPPPPILFPMPTMSWSITFCPALKKEPQSGMSEAQDGCEVLYPTDGENASMGTDSGSQSCSSGDSIYSNENSTNFICPPIDSSSGVGEVDDVHSDNVPQTTKALCEGLSTSDQEAVSCIDTDVEVAGNSENTKKQTFHKKGLVTEHGPRPALKVSYLHCLPHRPLTMLQKRKCVDDENRHVGKGHYLLNRSTARKASVSDLQQKARIFPCHVRLRKLSSRQIPQYGVQPQRTAPVLLGRRGRPRKWMWVKGKSGKLVRVLIPKKELAPSGVGDIEVLRKLRPSAQREVREAQLKTDQVPPNKKDDNNATRTALRPLPVRLAKINDKKSENAPRKQYNYKDSQQSMQPKTSDKAKPGPGACPIVKQRHASVEEDEVDLKWTVAACKKVQSTDLPCTCTVTTSLGKSYEVGNCVPSEKDTTTALASLSAGPKLVKKRGSSQKEKEVKQNNEMALGIRTLPHRRARTKVLKAFHAVILKKYQKPESFMPAAIRKLRQLPSRNKRLKESTKSMPSLSRTSRKHLLKTLQKTADCEMSEKYCPKRELSIVPHGFSDSVKERTVDDGSKDAVTNHSTDVYHDCGDVEEQMQVEQCSVVLQPMSPPTVKSIIADASGTQTQLEDFSSAKSEENMETRDMPVVKQEQEDPLDHDGPVMIKSDAEVCEKRRLRVLPERVARLREEERRREAKNTVTFTTASPSHEIWTKCLDNSPLDNNAKDMENPPLSIKTADKTVVLNSKIDSKSNPEHNKYLINDGISGRTVHNNAQEETRIQDITCKTEGEDIDDERKLRSLPCRMVAQPNNAWGMKKARGRLRKHSLLPSDSEPQAKKHQGRPGKHVLPEFLDSTMYTTKHSKHGEETVKRRSIFVDQATKSDDCSRERVNSSPSNLFQGSLTNGVTFDRELDVANVASSPNQEGNSNTETNTTSMEAAAATCDLMMKRKLAQKTDLRCECMSLNTSLTLQYQDAIISKGWVKTSEKPGRRDTSLIQSLFTQPVTYNTIMTLVGSSNSRMFHSQEQVALTQVVSAPKGKKGMQHNGTKSFKTKKKRFEEVSVTTNRKDLIDDVPISPSKPITMPISSQRAAKQQTTPRTKIHRQADRLRKTLRKFASVTPAKNRIIPHEDVGRRKCKAAKKLFIEPRNPSILWCHHPSSDSKTKGPNAKNSPKAGIISGAKHSSKPPSTNTTSTVQPPAKGRIENVSDSSSTTLSKPASSGDGLCGERDTLTGPPEDGKKSQGKKTSKKHSNFSPSTSKGSTLSKVKPKVASSSRKHEVDPITALDQSDHRDEIASNTAQASRSSARIQQKQLLGFSICPCCALVEAEHFERFKKRVKTSKSEEKHQTEKVSLPAKLKKEGNNTKKATGSVSQSDKSFKPKNKPPAKGRIRKAKDDRNPQDLGSPSSCIVNSSSDAPPVTCSSSEAVSENVPEDLSSSVPQLVRSTCSSVLPISSTQWGNLTHGDQILKEDPGAKDQVASPEVSAEVQNGEMFSDCENVVSCEEDNYCLDEEGFAGPLDLRVSWKKYEPV